MVTVDVTLGVLATVEVPDFAGDAESLLDALGDFIIGTDNENLWGAPN